MMFGQIAGLVPINTGPGAPAGPNAGDVMDQDVHLLAGPGGASVFPSIGVGVGPITLGPSLDSAVDGGSMGWPELPSDLTEDEDDNSSPNCNWKPLGYVLCLSCTNRKRYHNKTEMVHHYNKSHKAIKSQKYVPCTKCGQLIVVCSRRSSKPFKKLHKCTVPRGYQFN